MLERCSLPINSAFPIGKKVLPSSKNWYDRCIGMQYFDHPVTRLNRKSEKICKKVNLTGQLNLCHKLNANVNADVLIL